MKTVVYALLFASLLFFFTGCNNSVTPEEKPESKETTQASEWPQTITQAEKASVTNLSTASLSDSISSMQKIIEILTSHQNEAGVNQYKTKVETVKNAITAGNLSSFTGDEITDAKLKTFQLNELKSNDDGKYGIYSYNNYDNAHTTAQTAISAYQEKWASYNSARKAYEDAVSGISQPKYDAVANFAKSLVEDFKDNYIFNNTYNEKTVQNMVNEAIAEKNTVSTSVESEYTAYSAAYSILITAETEAGTAVNAFNNFELQAPVITTITLGNSDLSVINENTTSVTIAVPSGATDIDVLALAKLKRDVEDKFDDLYMDKSNISFADYPDSVNTFTLNMAGSAAATLLSDANTTGVKDNIALMKYLAPANEFEYTNPTPGASAEGVVEVIPGVKIRSFVASYPDSGKPTNNGLYRAFDFSGNNKTVNVEIPSEYDLTGTYKAGIIGNVNLTNLALKTISGNVLGKSGIDNLYNTFVAGKGGNLATLDLGYHPMISETQMFYSIDAIDTNMYDTKLDAIVTYYVGNAIGKFSTTMSDVVFDAKSTLNGGTMYNGDTYQGGDSLGSVNINTVLLTNASLSNIKVDGVKGVSANTISAKMANVYFDTVMKDVSITGDTKGVIEFAKAAPARISGNNSSKIIFNRVSNNSDILMTGTRVLDISSEYVDVNKIKYAGLGSKTIGTVIGNSGNVPSGFIPGIPDSRTSQQFEQDANQPRE